MRNLKCSFNPYPSQLKPFDSLFQANTLKVQELPSVSTLKIVVLFAATSSTMFSAVQFNNSRAVGTKLVRVTGKYSTLCAEFIKYSLVGYKRISSLIHFCFFKIRKLTTILRKFSHFSTWLSSQQFYKNTFSSSDFKSFVKLVPLTRFYVAQKSLQSEDPTLANVVLSNFTKQIVLSQKKKKAKKGILKLNWNNSLIKHKSYENDDFYISRNILFYFKIYSFQTNLLHRRFLLWYPYWFRRRMWWKQTGNTRTRRSGHHRKLQSARNWTSKGRAGRTATRKDSSWYASTGSGPSATIRRSRKRQSKFVQIGAIRLRRSFFTRYTRFKKVFSNRRLYNPGRFGSGGGRRGVKDIRNLPHLSLIIVGSAQKLISFETVSKLSSLFLSQSTQSNVNIYYINALALARFGFNDEFQTSGISIAVSKTSSLFLKIVDREANNKFRYSAVYLSDLIRVSFVSMFIKNAAFLAHFYAYTLPRLPRKRKEIVFLRFLIRMVKVFASQRKEVLGVRLAFNGRVNRWNRTKQVSGQKGAISVQIFHSRVEYGVAQAVTRKGTLGVRCWICYKPSFQHDYNQMLTKYSVYSSALKKNHVSA